MKLLVLTAVKAFEDRTRKILADNGVRSYSQFPVAGHWNSRLNPMAKNWFGTDLQQVDSLLFFAFVPAPTAEAVHEAVEASNATCDVKSRIHLAVMPIERTNFNDQSENQ